MLISLFENNKDESITVYVMQRDFTVNDKDDIEGLATSFGQMAMFLQVDETRFASFPTTAKFSMETYFRLIMSELLPEEIDRVLYLDVDVIVRGKVREFYDTDLKERIAAVCPDGYNPVLEENKRQLFKREGDMRYFNAGVMVWNVKMLRETYCFDDFMNAADELGFDLQYADQEILNYLLYDKVVFCDGSKFNYVSRGSEKADDLLEGEAVILHYAGCNPWQNGLKNDLYRIWWDYAKKTPYYQELLEENLWRELDFSDERNEEILRHMESREVYEYAFLLKGTGRIKTALDSEQRRLGIYGTGTMGEVLYELLSIDGVWDRISFVADKNWSDDFHGIGTKNSVNNEDNVLWIVTPVYRSKELVNHIREQIPDSCEAVSLREWLKNVP